MSNELPGIVLLVCCSEHFSQIPVGTVSLSDFLSRNGISNIILHTHLQPATALQAELTQRIADGWHVSLVLHWKENTETFYRLSGWVKNAAPPSQVSCGGITASFFHREILADPTLPDLVFRGDPDIPVLKFCKGEALETIPNLAWHQGKDIAVHPLSHLTCAEDFEAARFANYAELWNAGAYLRKANTLFLHIPISRGCWAECDYCGGSCAAYLRHSGRTNVLLRSVQAVVRDVEDLYASLPHDAKPLHLHFDDFHRNYMPVLQVLGSHPLASDICLYVTERGFLSADRLRAGSKCFSKFKHMTFEISPETEDDTMRRSLTRKSGKVHYDEIAVRELVAAGGETNVYLWVYYSVFNGLDTKESLAARISFLDRMQLFFSGFPNAQLIVHSLALDCASDAYMTTDAPPELADYRHNSGRFSTLLGNLTLADQPEEKANLMTCKFFIEIMRNPETYLGLRDQIPLDFSMVRRVVQHGEWAQQALNPTFDSYDFVASLLEDLSTGEQQFTDWPAVPTKNLIPPHL